jgi:hypothetical protein
MTALAVMEGRIAADAPDRRGFAARQEQARRQELGGAATHQSAIAFSCRP